MACLCCLLVLRLIGSAISSYGLRISSVRHATEPDEEVRKRWADFTDSDEDFQEVAKLWSRPQGNVEREDFERYIYGITSEESALENPGENKEILATREDSTREAFASKEGDSWRKNEYDPTAVSMQSQGLNTGAEPWEPSSPQAGAGGPQQTAWLYVPAGDVQQWYDSGNEDGTYYWDGVSYASYVGDDGVRYFQPAQQWVSWAQWQHQSGSTAASSTDDTRTGVEYKEHRKYIDKYSLWSEKEYRRPTTVMLRNIPRTYMKEDLIRELNLFGFKDKYDFLHLPVKRSDKRSIPLTANENRIKTGGMAFVNFIDHTWAAKCLNTFRHHQWMGQSKWDDQTGKISAAPAHIQGLEKNLEYYKDTFINNDPMFAPMVFLF